MPTWVVLEHRLAQVQINQIRVLHPGANNHWSYRTGPDNASHLQDIKIVVYKLTKQ